MRKRDARGNGGGFAPLEASCRRVVGVSRLYCCNSPRLLAVRSRFEVAWRPKCRPPRRQTPTMGCRGRGGLRSGHNGARPRMEIAREPLNMRVNPLDTHVNLSICVWAALPTCISSGPRARCRAHARVNGPRRESMGPGARRGAQAASMPWRTALPDTQCPHQATRSPTDQVRGGIHAPR